MQSVLTTLIAGLALSFTLATPTRASEDALIGNAEAGQAKSAACAACHMPDGNSAVPTFPKLAGQQPGYIAKQLADFKAETRKDASMLGMVATLTEQDMLDLDAYYASQSQQVGVISEAQKEAALAGEEIFRAGLAEFKVTACMACHGPDGKGVQPMFPRLAGQHAAYIQAQLLAFKNGSRTDPMMSGIAFPLSETQIKNLSIYISGLY